MRRSHTISISIERPYDEVYAYLSKPSNYERWAAVEPGTFKPLPDGDWQGNTLFGFRHFRFSPPNNYGVLDHAVFVPDGELLYTPMRVIPNEESTELTFTFFQRVGTDDAQFASAIEWITIDFLALKSMLEVHRPG